MKDVTIKINGNIQLRSWKSELATDLFRLTDKNRKHLKPWLPWVPGVKKIADSRKFITISLKEQKKEAGLELGIWYQDKLVGCIGLHGLSKDNRRASLGYWLDFNFQGRGIMTASNKALIGYAFKKLNLNRIGIEIATKNTKSLAIAKRLNFIKEGVAREFEFIDNRFLNYVVYSLLKREWKN